MVSLLNAANQPLAVRYNHNILQDPFRFHDNAHSL